MEELIWLKWVQSASKEKQHYPGAVTICRSSLFLFGDLPCLTLSQKKCPSIPGGKAFWHWGWKRDKVEVYGRSFLGGAVCSNGLLSFMGDVCDFTFLLSGECIARPWTLLTFYQSFSNEDVLWKVITAVNLSFLQFWVHFLSQVFTIKGGRSAIYIYFALWTSLDS